MARGERRTTTAATKTKTGTRRMRRRRPCRPTSTSWSIATGCGSRGGRPLETCPPPPRVMARRYVWWVGWRAWSSGGGCTRTWRGRRTCRRSATCTCSNLVSSPCGRIPQTPMAASGWYDCARPRRGVRGKTSAWRCWASSSWWARSCAGSCSRCASRRTTWRCGTARRRTRRRRRACGTPCAASCSCRSPCPSSTRRTATACAPPPTRARTTGSTTPSRRARRARSATPRPRPHDTSQPSRQPDSILCVCINV